MTLNSDLPQLTDKQKAEVCGVLFAGCDRQTAADMVGCSRADIRAAMKHDPEFAAEVRRTEAGCELSHMRVIQQAARDDKQWRASLWWLECRAPERYAPRGPGIVSRKHLDAFVTNLVEIIHAEIHDLEDRRRLVERLHRRAAEIDDALDDRPSSREMSSADWLKMALCESDSADSTADVPAYRTSGKDGDSNGRL